MFKQFDLQKRKPEATGFFYDKRHQNNMGWKECFSCGRKFRPRMKQEEFCKKCKLEGEAFDLLNNAA